MRRKRGRTERVGTRAARQPLSADDPEGVGAPRTVMIVEAVIGRTSHPGSVHQDLNGMGAVAGLRVEPASGQPSQDELTRHDRG